MNDNKSPQVGTTDPLASLHRMSTTAGVASQDYAAINLTAVVSLVLGVAGILLVLSNMLFVLPIAAIFCGIVALRQIIKSNGTQTGRGLALLGIVSAAAIGGFFCFREYNDWRVLKMEQAAINQLVADLQGKLTNHDYPSLPAIFHETFLDRKKIKMDKFIQTWQSVNEKSPYGVITSLKTNEQLVISPPSADGSKEGGTILVINFAKSETPGRFDIMLRKERDKWVIYDIPRIFPPPQDAPP